MRKNKKIGKRLAAAIVIAMAAAGSYYTYPLAKAVMQRENAVHIQANSIENSTLIVGTHLIHISALNDELYDIAVKSGEASGQNRIYYKSELGDGKWYDITSASSLSDITGEGEEVSQEEIQSLLLTHHTKSDGITYDLKKNIAVCIYDISDAYELEAMQELQPLCYQRELMKEREKNTELQTGGAQLVDEFLKLEVATEQTKVYDDQLDALQEYYKSMKKDGTQNENIEAVQKVMRKLDALRRKEVLEKVKKALAELEEDIRDVSKISEKKEIQASEVYDVDEALLEAVLTCQENVKESIITYEGSSFDEGNTKMSKMEYDLSKSLVRNCDTDPEGSLKTVEQLVHLNHIINGSMIAPASEAEILSELISDMEDEYKAVLEQKDEEKEIETKRNELQFYIQSKQERLTPEEAQTFLGECQEKSQEFLNAAADKDTKKSAFASVQQYQSWLKELISSSLSGNETSDLQRWKEEKEKLEQQKLSALDNNQVEEAKKIQTLIDNAAQKIEEEEKAINNEISRLNTLKQQLEAGEDNTGEEGSKEEKMRNIEQQIALLSVKLPQNSAAVNIQETKDKLLQMIETHEIAKSSKEEALDLIEGLGALLAGGSQTAGEALKEVYQTMAKDAYLTEQKEYDSMLNRIEELIAQNQVVVNQSLLNEVQAFSALKTVLGENLGNLTFETEKAEEEASKEQETTEEASEAEPEETDETQKEYHFTYNPGALDREDLPAAILALTQAAEQTKNTVLEELAAVMAEEVYNQEEASPIFLSRREGLQQYAPVSKLADILGYRYVWSDTKKMAVISKGGSYYGFQAFRKDVERPDGEREELPYSALFYGEIYIPFSYVEEEFGCEIISLGNTGYAVFADDEILQRKEEIEQALFAL